MVEQVTVFIPASIANLGCGFDIMGMAVESAGDILSMEMSDVEDNANDTRFRLLRRRTHCFLESLICNI